MSRLLSLRYFSSCRETSSEPGLVVISFVQTASGAHLSSHPTAGPTGAISPGTICRSLNLITHFHLLPRVITHGVLLHPPVYQRARCLMKGTRFMIIDALILFKVTLVLNADPPLWNCLSHVPAR
jgi:hypothetical protein